MPYSGLIEFTPTILELPVSLLTRQNFGKPGYP